MTDGPTVRYVVQFDSLRGYVVEKVTTEVVLITNDPNKANAFAARNGGSGS